MTLRNRPQEEYRIQEHKLTDGTSVFVPQRTSPRTFLGSPIPSWEDICDEKFKTIEEAKSEIDRRISENDQKTYIETTVTHEYKPHENR